MLKKKNIFWLLDSMNLAVESQLEIQTLHFDHLTRWQSDSLKQWAISNNGFRSDSLYEKKIGEDLVFNNALPKSLTINTSRVSKGKTKIA